LRRVLRGRATEPGRTGLLKSPSEGAPLPTSLSLLPRCSYRSRRAVSLWTGWAAAGRRTRGACGSPCVRDRGRDSARLAGLTRSPLSGMGGEPPSGCSRRWLPLSRRARGLCRPSERRCGGCRPPASTMTWLMTCCAGGQPGWPPRARSSPRRSCRNSAAMRPQGRARRGKRRRGPRGRQAGPGGPRQAQKKAGKAASRHGKPPRSRGRRSCRRRRGETPGRLGLRACPGSRGHRCSPRASTATPHGPRLAAWRRRQSIPRRQGQRPEHPSTGFFWTAPG